MRNTFIKLLSFALVTLSMSIGMSADSSDSGSISQHVERPMNLVKTNDFGLGAKWGLVTGLNFKYWTSEHQAWDMTLASSDNNTILGIDHIVHFRDATAGWFNNRFVKNIVPYAGLGVLASAGENASSNQLYDHQDSEVNAALRVPLGVEFLPTRMRIGVFAELGLGLSVAPKSFTFATADVGGRYYF